MLCTNEDHQMMADIAAVMPYLACGRPSRSTMRKERGTRPRLHLLETRRNEELTSFKRGRLHAPAAWDTVDARGLHMPQIRERECSTSTSEKRSWPPADRCPSELSICRRRIDDAIAWRCRRRLAIGCAIRARLAAMKGEKSGITSRRHGRRIGRRRWTLRKHAVLRAVQSAS